jgi:hypothetical protein
MGAVNFAPNEKGNPSGVPSRQLSAKIKLLEKAPSNIDR